MDENGYRDRAMWLKRKLDVLTELDSQLETFGACKHKFKLNPCLSEDELRQFEQEYKVILPPAYRAFLRYVGNGDVGPAYGVMKLRDGMEMYRRPYGDAYLSMPFHLTEAVNISELDDDAEIWHSAGEAYSYRHGCLCLAEEGCGSFDFLVVTGPCRGQIWMDAADVGIMPIDIDFIKWYDRWLNQSIASLYISQLKRPK